MFMWGDGRPEEWVSVCFNEDVNLLRRSISEMSTWGTPDKITLIKSDNFEFVDTIKYHITAVIQRRPLY